MPKGEIADESMSAKNGQTHGEHFRNVRHNDLTARELDLAVRTDLRGEVKHLRKGTLGSNVDLAA